MALWLNLLVVLGASWGLTRSSYNPIVHSRHVRSSRLLQHNQGLQQEPETANTIDWTETSFPTTEETGRIASKNSLILMFQVDFNKDTETTSSGDLRHLGPVPEDLALKDWLHCPSNASLCSVGDSCRKASVFCSCDQLCAVYGDCCQDFWTACPTTHQQALDLLQQHSGIDVSCDPENFVKVISSCPEGAHLGSQLPAAALVFEQGPVLDRSTGINYKNRSYALCNGVEPTNLAFWEFEYTPKVKAHLLLTETSMALSRTSRQAMAKWPPHNLTGQLHYCPDWKHARHFRPIQEPPFPEVCQSPMRYVPRESIVRESSLHCTNTSCLVFPAISSTIPKGFSVLMKWSPDEISGTNSVTLTYQNNKIPWYSMVCQVQDGLLGACGVKTCFPPSQLVYGDCKEKATQVALTVKLEAVVEQDTDPRGTVCALNAVTISAWSLFLHSSAEAQPDAAAMDVELLHRNDSSLKMRISGQLPLQSLQEPSQFQEMMEKILERVWEIPVPLMVTVKLEICFELTQIRPKTEQIAPCSDNQHTLILQGRSERGDVTPTKCSSVCPETKHIGDISAVSHSSLCPRVGSEMFHTNLAQGLHAKSAGRLFRLLSLRVGLCWVACLLSIAVLA